MTLSDLEWLQYNTLPYNKRAVSVDFINVQIVYKLAEWVTLNTAPNGPGFQGQISTKWYKAEIYLLL